MRTSMGFIRTGFVSLASTPTARGIWAMGHIPSIREIMTMPEHTPGPWMADKMFGQYSGLVYPRTSTVKHVGQVFGFVAGKKIIADANMNYAEWTANVRLIAAAPEMAKALRRAYWVFVALNIDDDVLLSEECIAIGKVLSAAGIPLTDDTEEKGNHDDR